MTEHKPWGYFKRLEAAFFRSEAWAITGPEHDHDDNWDIIADNILDEETARFIVRACNSHYELLEALKAIANFECRDGSYTKQDIAKMLVIAKRAIRKAEEQMR